MKYLLLIIAIGFVAVLLVGCGSSGPKLYNTVSTNTGLEYRDLVVGSGMSPVDEDIVQVHCTGWLQSGQIIESTVGGDPIEFAVGSRAVIDGWDQGIRGMKVGGKRRLVIPPQLGYGSAGNPQLRVPGGATLIYDIQLVNVKSLNWVTTASGLKYADLSVVAGPMPQIGQECHVHYTGWLEDGTKFDENQEPSDPRSFIIGWGDVIAGWDEGVAAMTVGSKRRMMILPQLGYGSAGNPQLRVPSGATLIYEIQLVGVGRLWTKTASGLKYADLSVVAGPTPQTGQRCYVHYTGWLQSNGTKFDENQEPSEPFSFIIGQGNVIPGWDEGVATMTVASKRRMIIPPNLAYGEAGQGSIPPNATLIFEVELLDIVPEP